ncbi:unnamed protein product [Cochlearia groenlandica]
MDYQEANSSSTRGKVDFAHTPIIKGKESKWNHRKSLAWNTAFFTNPGVLEHEELFGSLKFVDNEIDTNHKDKIKSPPCVSSETDARPSFAWDNAFFTEPGVLDAEELSLVTNSFTSSTQLRKSSDSMTTTSQGNRFSVSSIEFDLFRDMRASLRNSPNVKQTETRETRRKLPYGVKRTKECRQKNQPLSLIPQPKVSSSSSSSSCSISKPLTSRQAKPEKKCTVVTSELGENMIHLLLLCFKSSTSFCLIFEGKNNGKDKKHGFEEHSGSKSFLRSSCSSHAMKEMTSTSSGLRLPLPKMAFFDTENNGEKENKEPNRARRRLKSKLDLSSPPEKRSVLGQCKTRK